MNWSSLTSLRTLGLPCFQHVQFKSRLDLDYTVHRATSVTHFEDLKTRTTRTRDFEQMLYALRTLLSSPARPAWSLKLTSLTRSRSIWELYIYDDDNDGSRNQILTLESIPIPLFFQLSIRDREIENKQKHRSIQYRAETRVCLFFMISSSDYCHIHSHLELDQH